MPRRYPRPNSRASRRRQGNRLAKSTTPTGAMLLDRGGTGTSTFTAGELVRCNAGGTALESAGISLAGIAPAAAEFITLATHATLTNERVLTAGTAIQLDASVSSVLTVRLDPDGDATLDTLTLTPGTLAPNERGLYLLATQGSTTGDGSTGPVRFDVTTAGSDAGIRRNVFASLRAGYTGSSRTACFEFDADVAGTGSDWAAFTANIGCGGTARGTTTGHNLGGFGNTENGDVNVGWLGRAITAKNSAVNVGQVGMARNTGSSSVEIGLYGTLNNGTHTLSQSAALLANNGDRTNPIFVAQDNATSVFQIVDGGNVLLGTSTTPGGTTGKVLVFGDNAGNPTPGSNTAAVFAKDVAGTVEICVTDEGGTTTQISRHYDPDLAAAQGLEIDDDDPFPQIDCEENVYLGLRALTYTGADGRRQRIIVPLPVELRRDWTAQEVRNAELRAAAIRQYAIAVREHQRQTDAHHQGTALRAQHLEEAARGERRPDQVAPLPPPLPDPLPPPPAAYTLREPPAWLQSRGVRLRPLPRRN